MELPQSRIACHFAHLLQFYLKHVDKIKSSGAGAHHKHNSHQVGSNTRLGRIFSTAAERVRQVPENAFLETGRKRNQKVMFSAFLALYRLNEGKAILRDELILEEGRLIR